MFEFLPKSVQEIPMPDNIPRWAAKAVEHALAVRRIVYIAGAAFRI